MTQSFRKTLGGYDPRAGRNAHEANRPTLIPVPSLLRSLLTEHLDPGYAAAAEARRVNEAAGRVRPWWQAWAWQLAGAALLVAVFAVAMAQARATAPGVRETQQVLADSVRTAETEATAATDRRDELAAQVDTERRSRLEGDARGQQLLRQLDEAGFAAAATPVIGPGLTITVTEPGASANLSDVSKQRLPGNRQVILDRDLQLVVNWLWASGAEAVSVGGVRIGPNVTIRQAGGGILVDNQPISSPYQVLAVGPSHTMQDVFDRSPGLQRLRLLEASYGVGVSVSAGDAVTLPAGSVRELNFAEPIGP
ncbi:DUF881 domain-containing protein [Mycolicibacterium flavescens]|uniref:Membrane associated protein n=1 Tax=Mycolicibacterium flavescens TaxID=1776 RepID=A0A1E3RAB0_MYCFV|nr:DUF881 domain-containing protein [Mycolicibacterium flavescens]MCV7279106.1 DUF881 domain-containing protein [Mycolicibacterium flavescens]ODQ86759.1 hypothetical protein BHQ18_26290 [Mycolicibacterium flavescens]